MESNESDFEETPILSILQQIKEGSRNPRDLEKEIRQRCVEAMFLEGYGEAQIAQVLYRSEKTIRRDLTDIRKKNAVSPNVEQTKQIVGEMQQQVRSQISRLTRIAASSGSPTVSRISAEAVAWRIRKEFTEKLQSLGYLPLKPQEFVMTHQNADLSFDEIEATLNQVKVAAEENGQLNPQLEETIKSFEADLQKAKLNHDVTKLLDSQQNPPTNGGQDNEK